MEFLDSNLPESSIMNSRNSFLKAKGAGQLTENHQFSYALDLLRTSSKQNMKTAIFLLEDLFKSTRDDGFRRDCLFYLAIAHTKLPDYERALECCDNILKVQPQNHQTQQLKEEIHRRVSWEATIFRRKEVKHRETRFIVHEFEADNRFRSSSLDTFSEDYVSRPE
ncbi:hypothetical protein T265_01911 [Opisthorchis viverrini]|uniref:Uncharacterized protein n=1 Tax=Opisthorchis viverrini TaxID=6198 RepID=A0A074ZY14_OPIVI|nr:hypothetical protein T265_01911 [Opisthorchis viverrini]KER31981.1 hypothetical protein T265_01911 [Opisthorchis viverrini]